MRHQPNLVLGKLRASCLRKVSVSLQTPLKSDEVGKSLQFPNPQDLGLTGDNNFTIAPPPFNVNAPPKTLVDFSLVKIVLDYKDQAGQPTVCTVKIDP